MSENPYEYHEEADVQMVADGTGCAFPKTPFEISLRYRRRPCTLTVFADHLLIEGEKLPEPVRVERNEKFRFRFWSVICWGDFVFLYRKKKLKFKVRHEPQIFLKLGWLKTWQQCLYDPQEAAEMAKQESQDMILFWPKLYSLIIGVEFLLLGMIYFIMIMVMMVTPFYRSPERLLLSGSIFLLGLSCSYSCWKLRRRSRNGLWPFPVTYAGVLIIMLIYGVYIIVRHSADYDETLRLVSVYGMLWFLWVGVALLYYLPYRQLKRLDHQIRETRDKDDLPVR